MRFIVGFAILATVAGCGSSSVPLPPPATGNIPTAYAVIPDRQANQVVVKSLDLEQGRSRSLSAASSQGQRPVCVKTHPNMSSFYVLNAGSENLSVFTLSPDGTIDFLGSVASPPNPKLLMLHPQGGLAYCAGSSTLRSFTIDSSGMLTPLEDVNLGAGLLSSAEETVVDGAFSAGGAALHVPEQGGFETFFIRSNSRLTAGILTPLTDARDGVRDLDANPAQTGLEAVIRSAQGNDQVLTFELRTGLVGPQTGRFLATQPRLGLADFSYSGRYYLGSQSNGEVQVFEASAASGALSPLPGGLSSSPSSTFVRVNQSANLLLVCGPSRLTSFPLDPGGRIQTPVSDSTDLVDPGLLDTFLYFL
ncbi:MAG: hypothetical protein U0931_29385 [Vulcanimicrobiota bacterium]